VEVEWGRAEWERERGGRASKRELRRFDAARPLVEKKKKKLMVASRSLARVRACAPSCPAESFAPLPFRTQTHQSIAPRGGAGRVHLGERGRGSRKQTSESLMRIVCRSSSIAAQLAPSKSLPLALSFFARGAPAGLTGREREEKEDGERAAGGETGRLVLFGEPRRERRKRKESERERERERERGREAGAEGEA
jgi:hypothetical protein